MNGYLKDKAFAFLTASLDRAAAEQGLIPLRRKLETVVPDISGQYTAYSLNGRYALTKVRNMHAFQISLVGSVISEFESPVIVDIGDSSGTHLQYIRGLYGSERPLRCIGVNMDEVAVGKIRKKGFSAYCSRAEDLDKYEISADMFLCFEVLEHLTDPCRFLHRLSVKTSARYLVLTVPYVRTSRVGLQYIRSSRAGASAENTHIFELSPRDWELLFRFSGWKVVSERIYLQYPRKNLFRLSRLGWQKYDFEGFYGVILERDSRWSGLYSGW